MGVLDFLAQAGNRTAVGSVAQALGGKTQGQTTRDDWIDNQIPAIANRINQATTHDEIVKGMQDFVAGGLKAGIDPERLNKLTDSLVGPALRNLGANEIGKITQSLQPQTEPITPMVAPEGQGQPLDLATMFTPQTTPGRKPTEADIFKMAEIEGRTGVKPPANMAAMLQAPSAITSHETSTRKTQQELEAQQAKDKAIEGLSDEEVVPGTGISPRKLGRLGGLTQLVPQREQPQSKIEQQNQLLQLKEAGQAAAANVAQQRATAAESRAGAAESRAGFNQAAELRKELNAQSKPFETTAAQFGRIQELSKNTDPAGQVSPAAGIAIVNAYSKMVDEGNRVTDQDFKTAANAKPWVERAGLSWDSVKALWNGAPLTPSQVRDFTTRAGEIYKAGAQKQKQREEEYKRLSTGFRVDPSLVVTERGVSPGAPAGGGPSQADIDAAKKRLGIP